MKKRKLLLPTVRCTYRTADYHHFPDQEKTRGQRGRLLLRDMLNQKDEINFSEKFAEGITPN